MEVAIKIMGDGLLAAMTASKQLVDGAFHRMSRHTDPLRVTLHPCSPELKVRDLMADPMFPTVILAHAEDTDFLERLHSFEKRDLILASGDSNPLIIPIILVFGSHGSAGETREFPDLVADWFYMPVAAPELARRVVHALRSKSILKNRLCFGPLMLLPESRAIGFQGRTAILTKSEFALAELFLSQTGTVIPNSELIALFKATGKSTEGSNIRVTIFQLRLKLEMLTHSQYTVLSVYKQGYCLRQKARGAVQVDETGVAVRNANPARPVLETAM